MSIDSVKLLCPGAVDTVTFAEGDTIRVLVYADRSDSILVYPSGRVAGTMWLTSPLFRTVDSLGAGIILGRILSLPGLLGGYGEGDYYLYSERGAGCGLSFRLDDATASKIGTREVSPELLRPYAHTGRITAVLVLGCRGQSMRPPNWR